MKNVDVENILIAIMFNEPLTQNFSFFNLTVKVKEQFSSLLENVEPIPFIPGGQAAPPEVPRYILKSEEENIIEFTFSGLRFDFRFLNIKDFNLKYIKDNLETINSILNKLNLPPFRIGVVFSGKIIQDDDKFFLEDYVNVEKLSNSKEIQLSYRNMIAEEGYNLNKWVRYYGLNKDNTTNFDLDINTMDPIPLSLISKFNEVISKKIGDFHEHQ
jgi:hypothetical protein